MALELSATELVRNFADYLNRVAYRGEQYIIVRGGKPVAELRPLPFARRLGELPALLASLPRLGPDEAEAFERDIDLARGELNRLPISDPWASF